jgi:hypothetical protein
MLVLLMVLNPRLLYLLRTLTQIQPQKVLLLVRVLMLTLLSRMALLYPAPRIVLARLTRIAKSVASTGHVATMSPPVLSHTMMMTSMIAQRGKPPRKVEQPLLTLIPSRFEMVKMHHVFARQSPPRRHLLLFL